MPYTTKLPLDFGEALKKIEAFKKKVILAFAAAALAGCVQATPA